MSVCLGKKYCSCFITHGQYQLTISWCLLYYLIFTEINNSSCPNCILVEIKIYFFLPCVDLLKETIMCCFFMIVLVGFENKVCCAAINLQASIHGTRDENWGDSCSEEN